MSSDDVFPRKRTLRQKGGVFGGKRNKLDVGIDGYTPLDLHRLVHAMESDPAPEQKSWMEIQMRADLCRQMHVEVASKDLNLQARVEAVCQKAAETVADLQTKDSAEEDLVQTIFFKKPVPVDPPQTPVKSPAQEHVKDNTSSKMPLRAAVKAAAPTTYTRPTAAIADLQKQQREQMEEAVAQMASQMKDQTARIHSQLRGQTEHLLTDMEAVAVDNVAAVTDVAAATHEHVRSSWRRNIGTWTLLLTMAAAFVATVLTIAMVPKRNNACLFNCRKVDQFCRTLPSGRQECFDDPSQQRRAVVEKASILQQPTAVVEAPMPSDTPTPDLVGDEEESEDYYDDDDDEDYEEDNDKEDEYDENNENFEDAPQHEELEPPRGHGDEDSLAAEGRREDSAVEDFRSIPHHDDQTVPEPQQGAVNEAPVEEEAVMVDVPHHDDRPMDEPQKSSINAAPVEDDTEHDDSLDEILPAYSVNNEGTSVGPTDGDANVWDETALKTGRQSAEVVLDDPHFEDAAANRLADAAQEHYEHDRIASEYSFQFEDAAFAASTGDLNLLSACVKENPSIVYKQDANGWGLLHESARQGMSDAVRLLLESGCDASLRTIRGETALDLAMPHGDDHPAVFFLKQAVGIQTEELRALQNGQNCELGMDGECIQTAIPHLNVPSDADMLEAALREFDEMQYGANREASPHANDDDGLAYDPVEQFNGGAVAKETLMAASTLNGKAFAGKDLRRAATKGDVRLVRGYLAANPPFIDQVDQNGWTALHLSARQGSIEIVKLLLDAGADVHLRTHYGRTAQEVAITRYGDDSPLTVLLGEYME